MESLSSRGYEYGPSEKRGVVLGLHWLQIVCVVVAGGGAFWALVTDHLPLMLTALIAGSVVTFLPVAPQPPFLFTWQVRRVALVLQDSRPMVLWLPIMASWIPRRRRGEHRWASAAHLDQAVTLASWGSPGEAVLAAGSEPPAKRRARRLQPESVRGLEILSLTGWPGADLGVVHDPGERSYAAFVEVQGRDYALLAQAEKVRLNDLWGSFFDRYSDPASPVSRIQVIERTVPEDGEAIARAYEELRVDGPGLEKVHDSYAELVREAAPLAQRHECYVGLKVDLRRAPAWREARRRGGKNAQQGACVLVMDELTVLAQGLQGRGLTLIGALPPRRLAEVIRFGYDPEQRDVQAERERVPDSEEGVAPERAWPSYSEERLDHYRSDSGVHITGHIREWPRRSMPAGFLQTLLLETEHLRTFTMVYEVRPGAVAAKEFNVAAATDAVTQDFRAKIGQRDTPQRRKQRENVERAEEEAAEGHAVIAWSAYVICSGRSREEAEEAWAEVVSRASASHLELQRLYGLQEAAFTYGLPLCRGL